MPRRPRAFSRAELQRLRVRAAAAALRERFNVYEATGELYVRIAHAADALDAILARDAVK